MYEYYNANTIGRFTNDCTIRAISVAEGKTWDETYEELSDIEREFSKLKPLYDDIKVKNKNEIRWI